MQADADGLHLASRSSLRPLLRRPSCCCAGAFSVSPCGTQGQAADPSLPVSGAAEEEDNRPEEEVKVAQEFSECPSGKKGGDLGWFPRGKMAGPFQEVAFNTPVGATSAPFKSTHGYHFILCEGRKN